MSGAVFIVGSINADMVMQLPRLPRAGETALGGTFLQTQGGKGANQAVGSARLGRATALVAAVGSDQLGRMAVRDLQNAGVDVSAVATTNTSTGIALVLVDPDGTNLIGVAPGANACLRGAAVQQELERRLTPGDVVVASLEVRDDAVLAAAKAAGTCGARFVLNPAPARLLDRDLLARCDVLTPNEIEVADLGYPAPADLLGAGVDALIVTRGAQGADLYRLGKDVLHQEAFAVDVVDTTGAGDAFTSALAAALAVDEPIESALRSAVAAGSLATRALGARAGYATADEVAGALVDGRGGRQYVRGSEGI